MPGSGTHVTIIQHLALLAQDTTNRNFNPDIKKFLADPKAITEWAKYDSSEAIQSRYATLGSLGPDMFYLMLDYGGSVQDFEDVAIKIAGTYQCVGELSGEINNYVNSALNAVTDDVWKSILDVFKNVKGVLVDGLLDLLIDKNNFWYFFLPLREVDDYRDNWYWADTLHYVRTGCFTQKLLDNCKALQTANPDSAVAKCMSAYSLGYLSHYVSDVIGHAYVNRIVESPWRNQWQRHHLVENFMDAYVWASRHDKGADPPKPSTDEQYLDTILPTGADAMRDGAARLHYARLNDLCNIGYAGIDPIIDNAISKVCNDIQKGLFDIGASARPTLEAPDDPLFETWTMFVSDTIYQTYASDPEHPSRMGRLPTPDDIAGSYGAYRILLALSTEDDVDKPELPDIVGDLTAILNQMMNNIKNDINSVPPPPSVSGSGFSLDALWDATKAYIKWLGQVAEAALKVLGDIFAGIIQIVGATLADVLKAGLYLINSILYSIYHSLRMTLVMSAYSVPFNEDLNAMWGPLDLRTLWNTSGPGKTQRYPIEPVVSERDFGSDATHPFSPYRPYFQPSSLAPVNVEAPATVFPQGIMAWQTPDDMLEASAVGADNMFTVDGPAPPVTVPLVDSATGNRVADLLTFDGSQRYFGGIFANCTTALNFAVPYLLGTPYARGTLLPDYNLDSDRGFAWPCWDVDYSYLNLSASLNWNGCDPYPSDTLKRVIAGSLDWGNPQPQPGDPSARSGLAPVDPWGNLRSGQAWVNARILKPIGMCEYSSFPFPSIVVNPNKKDLTLMDQCKPQMTEGNLLTPDYQVLSRSRLSRFLYCDPGAKNPATDDSVDVFLHLPYVGSTIKENDGRLADFLRAMAAIQATKQQPQKTPRMILANAVSLAMGGGISPISWGTGTLLDTSPLPVDIDLVTALAQLAVTGRKSYEQFAQWAPQDIDLMREAEGLFPPLSLDQARLQAAAHLVLDTAYTALWAIRSNVPGWREFRSTLGWIAASGFDDTPHRPVNVPTAPYPQYDIDLDFPNPDPNLSQSFVVTTRYMVASAHTFVGPNDPAKSAFVIPPGEADLLMAPAAPYSTAPAPRTLPQDTPSIPVGNKIIIYIHGGGSRCEEAVDMANWFIVEGHAVGEEYTVISFDLPNSAYGQSFDVQDLVKTGYDHQQLNILSFEQSFIIQFIEKLDHTVGNVKARIVAVMGGSLGGNMSTLMTGFYGPLHPYLRTIVAWSVTAMAPSTYLGIVSAGDVAAYLSGLQGEVTKPEPAQDHAKEVAYLSDMYAKPLSSNFLLPIPPQPIMWFRGGYTPDGRQGWQPCKDQSIARSRFDRYEIYSPQSRHWAIAINLEQISFSFQDNKQGLRVVTDTPPGMPAPQLMLVAGEQDNFPPNQIYNSTIDLVRQIRLSGNGKAEFWLDTGHSIHNERPHLFAKEIIYFLTHPNTDDSPIGVAVTPVPYADPSMSTL